MNHRKPDLVGLRARGPTPNDIRHPVTTQHTTAPPRSLAKPVERKPKKPIGCGTIIYVPAPVGFRMYGGTEEVSKHHG